MADKPCPLLTAGSVAGKLEILNGLPNTMGKE